MAQDSNGLDHYFVWPNSASPMQLYLYNYNGSSNITNIFSWRPTETQWWITGFNPEYVNNVNVNTQVMVGWVDFSKYTNANGENEMYDKFKTQNQRRETVKDFLFETTPWHSGSVHKSNCWLRHSNIEASSFEGTFLLQNKKGWILRWKSAGWPHEWCMS